MFSALSFIFIIFVILKMVGVVDWSWVWVTSPLWIGLAIIIFFIIGVLLIGGAIIITLKKLLWH